MEIEERMAQWGGESNMARSVDRKIRERMDGVGPGGNNSKMHILWSIWHMAIGRTNPEVHG